MFCRLNHNLPLAALLALSGTALVGCQVDRPVTAPTEPTWDYRDGQTQLSNNDAWSQMIPATAGLFIDQTKVASVEDATE